MWSSLIPSSASSQWIRPLDFEKEVCWEWLDNVYLWRFGTLSSLSIWLEVLVACRAQFPWFLARVPLKTFRFILICLNPASFIPSKFCHGVRMLMYTAEMKLPRSTPYAEKRKRVDNVPCQKSRIGRHLRTPGSGGWGHSNTQLQVQRCTWEVMTNWNVYDAGDPAAALEQVSEYRDLVYSKVDQDYNWTDVPRSVLSIRIPKKAFIACHNRHMTRPATVVVAVKP